jgi:hypothetical protein
MNLSSPHHTGVVHDRAIPSHLILRPTSIHFSHPLAALLISYSISCCGKHAMCELRVSGEQGRTILRGCEGIDHSLVQFDDYFIYMTYIYIYYTYIIYHWMILFGNWQSSLISPIHHQNISLDRSHVDVMGSCHCHHPSTVTKSLRLGCHWVYQKYLKVRLVGRFLESD